MTCSRRCGWLLSALLFACGDDEGGDEANDSADERPGEDDFAPDEASATESASDSDGTTGGTTAGTTATTSASSADGSSSGGEGGCVEAGAACEPDDLCSTWSCTCVSGFEFMTVGTCDAGTCTSDGTVVCDPVCANNGGTMTAVDDGCA